MIIYEQITELRRRHPSHRIDLYRRPASSLRPPPHAPLLGLRIAQSFGEPTPYRLKVDGWVMGSNNCEDMSSDGHNGVAVENLEVLPRYLTPLDDGV